MDSWDFTIRWFGWAGTNVLLVWGLYRLLFSRMRLSGVELLTALGILALACLVAVETALGVIGQLKFLPIAISLALFSALMIIWNRKSPIPGAEETGEPQSALGTPVRILLWLLIALTLTGLGARMVLALTQPPSNWDSNWYHLPAAVEWLKAKSLWVESRPPYWYFPRNGELYLAWTLFPFRSDLLVNLYNFPVLLWLGCSVWLLAKKLELFQEWRWFLVLALPSMTVMSSVMLGTQKNDLLVATLFTSAAALLFSFDDQRRKNDARVLLSALSVGLLIGTKLNGLVYAIALLMVLPFLGKMTFKWSGAMVARYGAYYGSGLMLCVFWFVKSWRLTGHPFLIVDPYAQQGQGQQAMASSILLAAGSAEVYGPFLRDFVAEAGWLPLLGMVAAVILLFWSPAEIKDVTRFRVRLLSLLTLACFVAFVSTPLTNLVTLGHGIVRLGFPFVILSLLCLLILVHWLTLSWSPRRRLIMVQIPLVALILAPTAIPTELFHKLFVSQSGIAGMILFCLGLLGRAILPNPRALFNRAVLAGVILAALISPVLLWKLQQFRSARRATNDSALWSIDGEQSGIFRWLEATNDLKIVIYGAQIYYPFYGPQWQNQLYFDNSPELHDGSRWLRSLRQKGVDHIVFYKVKDKNDVAWPKQRELLLEANSSDVRVEFQDQIAEAWRLENANSAVLDYRR